jgi:hypothetical protein
MAGLLQAVSPTTAGWLVVAFCFVPAALYLLGRVLFEHTEGRERPRAARPRGRHAAGDFPEDTGQFPRQVVFVPGEGAAGNGEPPPAPPEGPDTTVR